MGTMANPSAMTQVAQASEEAGYESIWTGEHIVLPEPQVPPSPLPPEAPIIDTVVALTWMAAATSTIKLGTGIIILPQRRPAVLAKSLASLDVVSGGRLICGFGVGYIDAEMNACDTPMAQRGRRSDLYLEAMRRLWSEDAVSISNEFVQFDSITANPKPVQQPIPVVVGGHSKAAYRRAITTAQGWYGFARDVDAATADIAGLQEAAATYERPAELGELEISVTPPRRLQAGQEEAYAALGIDRLILQPGHHKPVDEILSYIDQNRPSA